MPRMHGLPPITWGSIVMRLNCGIWGLYQMEDRAMSNDRGGCFAEASVSIPSSDAALGKRLRTSDRCEFFGSLHGARLLTAILPGDVSLISFLCWLPWRS